MNHEKRIACIDKEHPDISIARQATLLDIARASVYYRPIINEEDIRIMHAIDELYTDRPIHGTRKLRSYLRVDYGFTGIGRDRIRRLLCEMGLEVVYPRKRIYTSVSDQSHKKYPYLLRGLPIIRPNQVWGTDITYVRLESGWAYLVALLDWFSRYVVAWSLSSTLEMDFCIENLERALTAASPEIHNSDQGSHFTSPRYTDLLTRKDIQISMDGRGRCFDNIFTERLWRTVKREDIYLRSYRDIREAREGLIEYFAFYNMKRRHQSLDYQTPAEIYFKKNGNNTFIKKVEIKSEHKNCILSLSNLSTNTVLTNPTS